MGAGGEGTTGSRGFSAIFLASSLALRDEVRTDDLALRKEVRTEVLGGGLKVLSDNMGGSDCGFIWLLSDSTL